MRYITFCCVLSFVVLCAPKAAAQQKALENLIAEAGPDVALAEVGSCRVSAKQQGLDLSQAEDREFLLKGGEHFPMIWEHAIASCVAKEILVRDMGEPTEDDARAFVAQLRESDIRANVSALRNKWGPAKEPARRILEEGQPPGEVWAGSDVLASRWAKQEFVQTFERIEKEEIFRRLDCLEQPVPAEAFNCFMGDGFGYSYLRDQFVTRSPEWKQLGAPKTELSYKWRITDPDYVRLMKTLMERRRGEFPVRLYVYSDDIRAVLAEAGFDIVLPRNAVRVGATKDD